MCLLSPQPCDLKEVVAYKFMFVEKDTNKLISSLTRDEYELGKTYEAQELDDLKKKKVAESSLYSKGFHAYANEAMARWALPRREVPIVQNGKVGTYKAVEVLLEDLTFAEKGDRVYVANKCTFLKILE